MNGKRYGVMVGASTAVLLLGSLLKFSLGFGAHLLTFSGLSALLPLVGLQTNPLILLCAYGLVACIKGSASFFVTWGIPTVCASVCFNAFMRNNRSSIFLSSVTVPLVCFALFSVHSVGSQAVAYTALWIIPVLVAFSSLMGARFGVVHAALASSFVAHALGSVIYLYRFSFTPQAWLSLIPVVVVERFGGVLMTVALYVIMNAITHAVASSSSVDGQRA